MSTRVYRAIVNGVHTRGDGGFLFLKGDTCAYMFPHELPPGNAQVREALETQLADDTAASLFYVLEEINGQARLAAFERTEVYGGLRDELVAAGAHDAAPAAADPPAIEELPASS